MMKEQFTVTSALCSICEKCMKKLSPDSDESYARELQKSIKHQIQSEDLRSEYRFTVSSCLGLCPANKCTVLVAHIDRAPDLMTFVPTLNLKDDTAEVFSAVKSIAKSK